MEPLDRTAMASQYKGQWVALGSDRETVVGHGKTVRSALESAKKQGCSEPVLTRMPLSLRSFVG